ncbi:MAG: MFS transporter [Acetobacteraceae bacterium]|nr:MFS transporter [Acetobacteraceae bacterium]
MRAVQRGSDPRSELKAHPQLARAGTAPVPAWVLALSTTLGMQTVASFLNQSLAILAPLLTAGAGVAPERIGNLSSLSSLGSVLFLLFGGPVLARFGPVRMLQAGALTATAGLVVAASGWWPLLLCAALMMGIGYGPSPPAGSRILAATAPPGHRTLIFSIKQAGAPAGGALAGLLLAPVAARWSWPAALFVGFGVGIFAAAAINPARARLDLEREPNRPIGPLHLFNPRKVIEPYVMLKSRPVLLAITLLAFSFAIVQGCLFSFSVTYLVTDRHLTLATAGMVYACLQFAGVFARIFLGWLADRTGRPAHNLTAQAFAAALVVAAYGLLPEAPSVPWAALLATVTGFLAASWNGIYMAEVARLAPADQIAEVTSSSTVVTFLGYVSGPSLFSSLVTLTGEYRLPFLLVAAQLAVMACVQVVVFMRRR